MSHENITALKTAEAALRKRELELEQQTRNLEEANIALRVLSGQQEKDRTELEEKVLLNVRNSSLPALEKLKHTRLEEQHRTYLEIMESCLQDIVSPFLYRLRADHLHLTPQEIRVATLVKDGKPTKEIAQILLISANAVDFHRKNIRKKLGLNNAKTNLRSYLLSMSVAWAYHFPTDFLLLPCL